MKSVLVFFCIAVLAVSFADAIKCPSVKVVGKTLDCPLPNGVCCTNGDYCCPETYVCGNPGRCTRFRGDSSPLSSSSPVPLGSSSSSASEALPNVGAVGSSAAMQQVLQSASQVAPPPVDPSAGSSLSSSLSSESSENSLGAMPGTNAVMQSGGSADVPRLESSGEEKSAIVILKNVNSLYKGPPKNGVIQPITEKDLESSESSGSASSK